METSGLSAFGLRMWMVVRIKTNRRFVRMSPRRRGVARGVVGIKEFEELHKIIKESEQRRNGDSEAYS